MNENQPEVAVVIPTFNRAEMVCKCVASVFASDWKNLRVAVVDDCSPDGTAAALQHGFAAELDSGRLRYSRNERNSFQAVSRNNGARLFPDADFYLFLDDDNIVSPGMVRELVAAFERHPKAGLVAPVAIHRRKNSYGLVWTLGSDFNRWTSQPKDNLPNIPEERLAALNEDFPTTYSPNAFMVSAAAYRAAKICDGSGFDESFVQIFEESDFGWRVIESGFEGWITKRAVTEHYGFLEPGCVPELRQLGIEKPYRTFCFARNRLRFARRHFNFLQNASVHLVFAPLSCLYYCAIALRNRRPDIARAYLTGTLCGIFGIGGHDAGKGL